MQQQSGVSRQIEQIGSPKHQFHYDSGQSSRVAGSYYEGVTTSRHAGSNVPFGYPHLFGAQNAQNIPLGQHVLGQLSPRAPLNLQFHNENVMTFLKNQKARIDKLVHPHGTEAALNKASQRYQQPLSAVDHKDGHHHHHHGHGHGHDHGHNHDHGSQHHADQEQKDPNEPKAAAEKVTPSGNGLQAKGSQDLKASQKQMKNDVSYEDVQRQRTDSHGINKRQSVDQDKASGQNPQKQNSQTHSQKKTMSPGPAMSHSQPQSLNQAATMSDNPKQQAVEDENDSLNQNLASLNSALELFIKVLGYHNKIQGLSIGQILQLSNKMRRTETTNTILNAPTSLRGSKEAAGIPLRGIDDSQGQTGDSGADQDQQVRMSAAEQTRQHDIPNELIDISFFDLSKEIELLSMEAPEEEAAAASGTENTTTNRESKEHSAQQRRQPTRRQSNQVSVPQPNPYKEAYFKARKLCLNLRQKMQEMRMEQIYYIIGTIKLLVIFLKVTSATDLHKSTPNQLKYIRFLINLELRIKTTSFVLIQRLSDEEKMNRIAREAIDTHAFSVKAEAIEKKRQQAQQSSDMAGVGAAVQRLKQLAKDAKEKADARKLFDQNETHISVVDELLFNQFTLSELCKLKLDFLALLRLKKPFLQNNFDEHTRVEMQRFENQRQNNVVLSEFLEDAKRCHQNLMLLQMYGAPKRDPVKIYFEISAKNLVLSNRLTGPALASDPNFAYLLSKFYCSQVILERDPNQIHFADQEINFSAIMEKIGTVDQIRDEYQKLNRFENLRDGAGLSSRNPQGPGDNRSTTNFTKKNTSNRHSDLTGSVETSSPSRFVPSPLPEPFRDVGNNENRLELMIEVNSSVLDGGTRLIKVSDQGNQANILQKSPPCMLQVSNSVIQCDLLVQSLFKNLFGVELTQSIEGLFKLGLLSVAGRQPPQEQWAQNAKSGAYQGRDYKEYRVNQRTYGLAAQKGLDLEEHTFLGAVDYKAGQELQNQDLEGCRSEGQNEAIDQDYREPNTLNNDSGKKAEHQQSVQQRSVFGKFRSSVGSWATSKPQSHRERKTSTNQMRVTGASQIFGEFLKSNSLCSQDLILLTDFVTLPELVSVFCQAQQEFSGIQIKNLNSTAPSLMTLERIQDFLLKSGKNELYLKHQGIYVDTNYPAQLTQKRTKFHYVQSLHPADFSMFQPHGYGPEPLHMHTDQDLLITLLLTGLFNIKSLGQREIPDLGDVEFDGRLGSEPRIRRYVEVDAVESVEEYSLSLSSGQSLMMNQIQKAALMTQYFLNSHVSTDELLEPLRSVTKHNEDSKRKTTTVLDEVEIKFFDQDQDKPVNTGDQNLNLVFVLNQLTVHQTLARLKFEHQAMFIPEIAKLFYRDVLGVHRLYTQTFIDLLASNDPELFGSYAMMNNLGSASGIQKKNLQYDDGGDQSNQKYTFLPFSFARPELLQSILYQQQQNNSRSPSKVTSADRQDPGARLGQATLQRQPILAYQDFLENPHIDQERKVDQNDSRMQKMMEQVDVQVLELKESKQRFLQKLANIVQRDHLENEKLHFLIRQQLAEESSHIWRGPEQEKDDDEKKEEDDRGAPPKRSSKLGKTDGRSASNEGNQGNGARVSTSGTPAITGTTAQKVSPGRKQEGQHTKPQTQSVLKSNQTNEIVGSQQINRKPTLSIPTKPKVFSSGQMQNNDPSSPNVVTVLYRDYHKMDENERARLLRILKKQAVIKGQSGKRLTDQERAVELEKIERRCQQDLLKKAIIEEEYQKEQWYFDTIVGVSNETKYQALSGELNQIEELLYACDLELLRQRKVLVTMLKSVEHGMDDREYSIREQLRQIAILEMQKGKDEDEMLDQTLKAIEIDVHIQDIPYEKERLTNLYKTLYAKQQELENQVNELDDPRKRKGGRVGAAVSPRPGKTPAGAAGKDTSGGDQGAPAGSKKDKNTAVGSEQVTSAAKKDAEKSGSSSALTED